MTQKKPDSHRESRLQEVCDRIGHRFKNIGLLNRALSHSSLGNEGLPNYERLEFLGDAVLGFLVAESLYKRKPEVPEGELTSRRSLMVSRRPLALVADDLELGTYMRVGRGLTDDALNSQRILADLVEAVLAAIYLDGGIRAARRFVQDFVIERFQAEYDEIQTTTDAKTRLNQWAQCHDQGVPNYRIVEVTGPDHDPTFRVSVTLGEITAHSSEVKNKQTGEQEAADAAYEQVIALEYSSSDSSRMNNRELEPTEDDEIQIIWDEPGDG